MKRNRGVMPESFRDCLSYGEQVAYLYKMISEVEKEEGPAGPPGATPIVSASATIDSNTGVPSVDVVKSGSDLAPSFGFNFHNLRGERGLPGTPGSSGSDGVGITSIAFKETDASGNNIYTVNLSDSTSYDIIVPRGPQGVAGQSGSDGRDGVDGVGVTSIVFKETDANGNNVYTVNLSDSTSYDITCPRGPQGPAGSGSEWVLKKSQMITTNGSLIEEDVNDPFITDNDEFLIIYTYIKGTGVTYNPEYIIKKIHFHKESDNSLTVVKDDFSDIFSDTCFFGGFIPGNAWLTNNLEFINLRMTTELDRFVHIDPDTGDTETGLAVKPTLLSGAHANGSISSNSLVITNFTDSVTGYYLGKLKAYIYVKS